MGEVSRKSEAEKQHRRLPWPRAPIMIWLTQHLGGYACTKTGMTVSNPVCLRAGKLLSPCHTIFIFAARGPTRLTLRRARKMGKAGACPRSGVILGLGPRTHLDACSDAWSWCEPSTTCRKQCAEPWVLGAMSACLRGPSARRRPMHMRKRLGRPSERSRATGEVLYRYARRRGGRICRRSAPTAPSSSSMRMSWLYLASRSRAAQRAGLDLARVGRDREVGDRRVLGLARAVRDDGRVAGAAAPSRRRRASRSAMPIWLTLTRIELAMPSLDAARQALGVGDEQVVADELASCRRAPRSAAFQPSQSSSAMPSSIETIG